MTDSYRHGNLEEAAVEEAVIALSSVKADDLNLRNLARQLGVTHGALYRHFISKDALLLAVAARGFALLVEHCSSDVSSQEFIRSYLHFALARPHLYDVMMSRSNADFDPPTALRQNMLGLIDTAKKALAADTSSAKAAHVIVLRYWMLIHGAIALRKTGVMQPQEQEEFIELVVRLAL